LAVAVAASPAVAKADGPLVEVWKSPSCGCCKEWVAHLEANGFRVSVHDVGNTGMRGRLGNSRRVGLVSHGTGRRLCA